MQSTIVPIAITSRTSMKGEARPLRCERRDQKRSERRDRCAAGEETRCSPASRFSPPGVPEDRCAAREEATCCPASCFQESQKALQESAYSPQKVMSSPADETSHGCYFLLPLDQTPQSPASRFSPPGVPEDRCAVGEATKLL